jgi:hypothetical protein
LLIISIIFTPGKGLHLNLTDLQMKKILIISLVTVAILVASKAAGQGFVADIGSVEGLQALYGNPCIVKLASGEEIHGKFLGFYGSATVNGFNEFSMKREDGEKTRFGAAQVISLQIKASDLVKLCLIVDASSSIQEMVNKDYNEIINREYVIFETALTPKETDKYQLMQLVNPGFDNSIKVFAVPGKQTMGWSAGGVPITGGEARAYRLVKGKEKAVEVKKGNYSQYFESLYSDCPKMLSAFNDDNRKWDDIALHVFFYDQVCK